MNLATGDIEHHFSIDGLVQEPHDVAVFPGVIWQLALGFQSDEIRFGVWPVPD